MIYINRISICYAKNFTNLLESEVRVFGEAVGRSRKTIPPAKKRVGVEISGIARLTC